jgi:hypothetical protein
LSSPSKTPTHAAMKKFTSATATNRRSQRFFLGREETLEIPELKYRCNPQEKRGPVHARPLPDPKMGDHAPASNQKKHELPKGDTLRAGLDVQ